MPTSRFKLGSQLAKTPGPDYEKAKAMGKQVESQKNSSSAVVVEKTSRDCLQKEFEIPSKQVVASSSAGDADWEQFPADVSRAYPLLPLGDGRIQTPTGGAGLFGALLRRGYHFQVPEKSCRHREFMSS